LCDLPTVLASQPARDKLIEAFLALLIENFRPGTMKKWRLPWEL
jgi:crotonobetainyl-CoA:carnitine CoA-transferase CaiB-like acyl-CoA transferase